MASQRKFEVRCECGRGYRVPAKYAGRKMDCRSCGQVLVLRRRSNSTVRLLASIGVDAESSAARYQAEAEREAARERGRSYRCSDCSARITRAEVRDAYVKGELLCVACRSGAVELRRSPSPDESREARRADVTRQEPRPSTRWSAVLGHAALFFCGSAGPLHVVLGLAAPLALALGLALAVAGAALVGIRGQTR